MSDIKLFRIAANSVSQVEGQSVAVEHVERLTPSLLAKAFRGELVGQEAGNETAEKLLERMRKMRGLE